MINIREYKESDREAIIKLVNEVCLEIFNEPAYKIEDLDNIKKEYFGNKGVFYVAEDNGKLIGTIAVKEKDGSAKLKRMYVAKDYRRKGIGKQLLNKIIEFCRSKGYKKIILSTYPQMKDALEFYKKNGFKEYKDKENHEQLFFERAI